LEKPIMIALNTPRRDAQADRLEAVSREQDDYRHRGVQVTYSQAELGRRLGVSRARIEQIEIEAKLRLLKRLACRHGQGLLDLGGTYRQLAFLQGITVSSTTARRLWRQWCELEL
jgi:hypothetical protein